MKKMEFLINEGLKTINLKDAFELIEKLNNDLCPGCNCKMLFCNYKPWCIYQFSFDRIDNNKIHSIDNLRIVCYNCNSLGLGSTKSKCSRGCHIEIIKGTKSSNNFVSNKFSFLIR